MNNNWLKILVAIAAIMIAGSAAYFSVTGLGVLFSGAAIAVMVMAGSLEFAKLVTATYLKQEWNNVSGVNKWYLTSAVVILMAITSAGIFGYLSNAFQQQNIKLEQVQREIDVWNNKIKFTNDQIGTLQGQQKDLSTTQNTLLTKGNVNSRLIRSADNRDKQSTKLSDKINILQDSIVSYNGHINDIKNNNIGLEREVGGFRFVAEAFGVELKSVVKFFIFLIVIVFDPLAVALVISFNQLVLGKRKEEDEITSSNSEDLKDFIDNGGQPLKLSEEDLKKLEEVFLKPPPPNEALKKAAEEYKRRGELLGEIMKNDEELGLYDEPLDNPMIKKDDINLKEIVEKLQDKEELFPESNQRAKEIIENSNWDVTLMDGLEDEEPFFTEEEIEKILQEEPTEEDIQRNFSTIEPNTENIFQEEFDIPVNEAIDNEPELIFEEGQLPDDMLKVLDEIQTEPQIEEDNERMDIIGQNGNEGLHYDNVENTSSEQDDEKKK
jgi:hypothetical protein